MLKHLKLIEGDQSSESRSMPSIQQSSIQKKSDNTLKLPNSIEQLSLPLSSSGVAVGTKGASEEEHKLRVKSSNLQKAFIPLD
jgi:hypothetical protein